MKFIKIAILCAATALLAATAPLPSPILSSQAAAAPKPFDAKLSQLTATWDSLVQKHVKPQGVDYIGLKGDAAALKAFIDGHKELAIASADDATKKAAYINLYNAVMMHNILRYAAAEKIAVDSAKFLSLKINGIDVPGGNIWNGDYKVVLAGQSVNLDNIEHQLIRGQSVPARLKALAVKTLDPRIHAAVNCAAKSCPPVRQRAYTKATVDTMLTENMTAFLSANRQFSKAGASKMRANSIVQWYYSDFDDFGQQRGMKGAGDYLAGFIEPSAKDAAWKVKHLKTSFNDRSKWSLKVSSSYDWHYDWLINDLRNFK